MSLPSVSVICPVYNEACFIASCITSILKQDFPKEQMEILLVDGRSTDNTREIVAKFSREYNFIRLLDNPYRTVPHALNVGINAAIGNVIIRLDAHANYPVNYISLLVRKLTELKADNVGGVCRTLPADNTTVAHAIAIALSSAFGMGNSYFRIGANKEMQVDTVPFGCFYRSIFDKIGLFDEELTRNQDDEFNARIIRHGGKIYLIPAVVIDYFARSSLKRTTKMYYQYGLFKPLVAKKIGRPATMRQFVPLLFLCGLVLGLIGSCVYSVLWFPYLAVVAIYLLTGLIIGGQSAVRCRKPGLLLLMPLTFLFIHLSYAWGYVVGICKILTKSSFSVTINR